MCKPDMCQALFCEFLINFLLPPFDVVVPTHKELSNIVLKWLNVKGFLQ